MALTDFPVGVVVPFEEVPVLLPGVLAAVGTLLTGSVTTEGGQEGDVGAVGHEVEDAGIFGDPVVEEDVGQTLNLVLGIAVVTTAAGGLAMVAVMVMGLGTTRTALVVASAVGDLVVIDFGSGNDG